MKGSQCAELNQGDGKCQECKGPNPIWYAPNDLWNFVIGGPNATDDPGGVLCPACFMIKANQVLGKEQVWKIENE